MELPPDDPDELWDWLLEQEQVVVLELLAFCVGQTVHAVRLAHDSRNAETPTIWRTRKLKVEWNMHHD